MFYGYNDVIDLLDRFIDCKDVYSWDVLQNEITSGRLLNLIQSLQQITFNGLSPENSRKQTDTKNALYRIGQKVKSKMQTQTQFYANW